MGADISFGALGALLGHTCLGDRTGHRKRAPGQGAWQEVATRAKLI